MVTQTRPAAESFIVFAFERGARVLHADIINKCLCCGEGSAVEQSSESWRELSKDLGSKVRGQRERWGAYHLLWFGAVWGCSAGRRPSV